MHRAYRDHSYVRRNRPVLERTGTTGDIVQDFYNQIKGFEIPTELDEQSRLKQMIDRGLQAFRQLHPDDADEAGQSTENVQDLEQTIAEGVDAYLKLYEGNLRLVYSWIHRYSHNNPQIDPGELLQVGLSALPRAIENFDSKKGFKFSTYATWWIRQQLQRHIRGYGAYTRIPSGAAEAFKQLDRLTSDFYRQSGRAPSNQELCEQGYSQKIINAWRAEKGVVRLDSQLSDDTDTDYYNLFPAPESSFASDMVEQRSVREELAQLFGNDFITHRMRLFVGLRYGIQFQDVPDITQMLHEYDAAIYVNKKGNNIQHLLSYDEIGRINGLTHERVRQIIEDAFSIVRITKQVDYLGDRMNMDNKELRMLKRHLFGWRLDAKDKKQVRSCLDVLQLCFGDELEQVICDIFGAESDEAHAMRARFSGEDRITSITVAAKPRGFDKRKIVDLQEAALTELAARIDSV